MPDLDFPPYETADAELARLRAALEQAQARAVELSIPYGEIGRDTEIVYVRNFAFLNSRKHREVVKREIARAEAAERDLAALRAACAKVISTPAETPNDWMQRDDKPYCVDHAALDALAALLPSGPTKESE